MEKQYDVKEGNLRVWAAYDEMPVSPRDGQTFGKIIGQLRDFDVFDQVAKYTNLYSSWEEWRKGELPKDVQYLPVYAYIHSGISLSTEPFGDRWDSSQIGYIYATPRDIKKNYGAKRMTPLLAAAALKEMKREIMRFDRYLNSTYYYVRAEKDGEEIFSAGTMMPEDLDDFLLELPAGFEPLFYELKRQMK